MVSCYICSAGPAMATAKAYNGRAFECYLCSGQFGSLPSLNQHLNSGVHLIKDFRCKKCGFTAVCKLSEPLYHEICATRARISTVGCNGSDGPDFGSNRKYVGIIKMLVNTVMICLTAVMGSWHWMCRAVWFDCTH